MAEQGLLALFDDEPPPRLAPAPEPANKPAWVAPTRREGLPGEDRAIQLALAYEKAVLDAKASFRRPGDREGQRAACVRFAEAMEPFMALAPEDFARADAELKRRRRITGREWREIEQRMLLLQRESGSSPASAEE